MKSSLRQAAVATAWASLASAVTVLPGGVPKPYRGPAGVPTAYDFFTQSAANEFANRTNIEIYMSNRDNQDYYQQDGYQVLPSADSFVRGVLQAWGEHLHLVLGPDEVWLTVLAQLNFYINANVAEVAATVYDLKPNQTITVDMYPDWYTIMSALYSAVSNRTKFDWVHHQFVSPNFTTSTDEDVMSAHILMLAQTRAYLRSPLPNDGSALLCGLPSVTLLGTRQDWAGVQWRIEQLGIFGPEAAAYGRRLLPVAKRFVQTFDAPDEPAVKEFWNAIVVAKEAPKASFTAAAANIAGSTSSTQSGTPPSTQESASCSGSGNNGPSFNLSGWITAFYFWDSDGKPYGRDVPPADRAGTTTLDNVTYPTVDLRTLPVSYGRATFILPRWNETDQYEVSAMGGPLGKRVDSGAPLGYIEALNRTLHPVIKGSNGTVIAPWDEVDDGSGMDIHNRTWAQWANATFGVDPRKHGTLAPLTSWVLYGPVTAANASATRWQPELELGSLAAALLSHYNASECAAPATVEVSSAHARRRGPALFGQRKRSPQQWQG